MKVLADVTIGDNSVIGAGSVVTKDIPANVIAVGNPCKVLRPITPNPRCRFSLAAGVFCFSTQISFLSRLILPLKGA